ncbi:helix-turn-helix domain-containing protein [Herbaspirillum robiniae]|uniref:helix-turn-helix domain-containing protein n=1 Tax=Herbaspirillum robiniae TaxID=2014887 RepID=UPI0009A15F39|nr:helix-turn-helix domain-containing protein [Herbaspirillum robiniae]
MKTPEYLDSVKRKLDLPSDYALAKALGVTRGAVSSLQLGKTSMSDEMCLKVAEYLGISSGRVLIDMHMERSKAPEVKAAWAGLVEKISASFESLIPRANPRPA